MKKLSAMPYLHGALLSGLMPLVLSASSFAAAPPDATPVHVSGELTVLYLDDFKNKRSERQYFVEDKQSKKRYQLKFDGIPPGHLRTGKTVTVRGNAKGKEVYLAADGVDSSGTNMDASATAAVTGEQKVIVMVADFTDSTSCSVDAVRDLMFTDPSGQSIDDLYQETSLGAVWLTGDVTGSYSVSGSTTGACEWNNWVAEVEAAALADNVNLNAYDRKVFVLPMNTNCGFTGLGTVGGNPSTAIVLACDNEDTYAHELGHNINMNHASSVDQEYGDGSDFMGMGGMGLRQINAPHQEQNGWRNPDQVLNITDSGFYDIAPLELDAAQALAPQMLKIAKPDTGEHYYLSYRGAIGFDQNLLPGWLNKTSVHRYKGDGGKTYWLGVLADGANYVDASNAITITQISNTPDYVTVQVQLDGSNPTCTVASSLVNLSPSSQSANAGSSLDYTVNVTNQDSAACSASSFTFTNTVPIGWTGTVLPTSLSLGPGETGTATFSVASAAAEMVNTYSVGVTATDNGEVAHTATGNASYTVLEACAPATPSMSVSPGSQNGDPSATLMYTISMVNNDNAACSASTFDLTVGSLPGGWSASLSGQSLGLAPGASGTAELSVTSAAAAAPGSYSVQLAAADAQEVVHATSANATYDVNDMPPTGDFEPPTTPNGLSAKANAKRVNLSWSASSDNVGVAGYRVYRDGAFIATTVDTAYADRNGETGVTYAYTVAAYDAANNASATSASVMAAKGKSGGGGKGKPRR